MSTTEPMRSPTSWRSRAPHEESEALQKEAHDFSSPPKPLDTGTLRALGFLRRADLSLAQGILEAESSGWSSAEIEVLNRAREMMRQVRVRRAGASSG